MKQKMKQIWSCAILLAAVLLTSCNSEETLFNGEEPQSQTGKLSFVIPLGGNKTVTYATPADVLDGLDEEYQIKELFIYWFKVSDGKLFKVFALNNNPNTIGLEPDGITLTTPNGNTTVATISVGTEASESRFYIVANVNGNSLVTSQALLLNDNTNGGGMTINQSTIADFEAALSDALTAGDVIAANGNLKAPLPMSINTNSPGATGGFVYVQDPSNQSPINDVNLKRRVARFDVVNHSDYSGFKITKVYVSNAQTKGYLHDKNLTGSESWPTAKFEVDGTGFNGTPLTAAQLKDTVNTSNPTTAADSIPDKIPDGFQVSIDGAAVVDSMPRHKAAFYTFPTQLAAGKTEILIEGTFDGITKLYSLDLTPHSGSVDIKANYLYTLQVKRATSESIKIALLVEKWEDGGDSIIVTGDGTGVTNWGAAQLNAESPIDLTAASPALCEFTSTAAAPATLVITNYGTARDGNENVSTIAFSPTGTAGVDYLAEDFTAISSAAKVSSNTMTYGALYKTVHTITLPPTKACIDVKLVLTNVGHPDETKTLPLRSINYMGLGAPVIDGLYWAAVNLGASVLPETTSATSILTGAPTAERQTWVGDFYQWGRNVAHPFFGTVTTVQGPLSAADATANTTDFIISATNDWLDPTSNRAWDAVAAILPPGWRLPTKAEWDGLVSNGSRTREGSFVKVVKSGGTVYFPLTGNLVVSTGQLTNQGIYGHYWNTTPNAAPHAMWITRLNSDASNTVTAMALDYAVGANIRVVRDVTAAP